MSRRRSRQAILQILYRDEFHARLLKKNKKESIGFYLKNLNKTESLFVLETLKGIQNHQKDIDEIIQKYAQNWTRKRISLVDLNIMRLAVFEILFCSDIPDKVALNEALELAKLFGEKKSVSFVNGILDQVLKSKEASL